MPEISDNHEPEDATSQFEDWLNQRGNLTLYDIDNIQMVLYMRLRSLMTVEQLHHRAHHLIQTAEAVLQTPGSVADEQGNIVQPILVENFSGPEEVLEMFAESSKLEDDAVMAEWMASLVREQSEGEEE